MPVAKDPRTARMFKLENHYSQTYPNAMGRSYEVIPGEGDVMSRVVFVDQQPRVSKMRMGLPFIGEAGNLVTKMLHRIGLDRAQIFYTYVLKYAIGGKLISDSETERQNLMSAARVMMHWELDIIKPDLVVTLGLQAARVFDLDLTADRLFSPVLDRTMHSGRRMRVARLIHPSTATLSSNARRKLDGQFAMVAEELELPHGTL